MSLKTASDGSSTCVLAANMEIKIELEFLALSRLILSCRGNLESKPADEIACSLAVSLFLFKQILTKIGNLFVLKKGNESPGAKFSHYYLHVINSRKSEKLNLEKLCISGLRISL